MPQAARDTWEGEPVWHSVDVQLPRRIFAVASDAGTSFLQEGKGSRLRLLPAVSMRARIRSVVDPSTLQGSGSYLRGLLGSNTWPRGASLTESTCLVHMLRPGPEFAEEPLDAEALDHRAACIARVAPYLAGGASQNTHGARQ
jgi:hypothetical protein